jgi:hypothetical protein
MSFDPALDSRLRNHLAEVGPIDIQLTQREYQYLRSQVRLFWNDNPWSSEECARFLLFMRGYSFFREIDSSREREFWSNFFRELELAPEKSKPNYSEINKALQKNQITNPLIQHGGGNIRTRTEYVQTFESIWGIRSLNAVNLEKLFRRYYFQDLPDVDEALIRKLLNDISENDLQRAVRQSASYNRIFSGLKKALEFIKYHKIETEPLETLTSRIGELGFEFPDPNPIDFFRNKAEKALRNLLGQLRGETRFIQHEPRRFTIQDESEDDEIPRQKQTRAEFQIEVEYSKNTHEYDSRVNLEYQHLPSGSRVLRLTGATQKEIEFDGNTVGIYLEIGETLAQVFVNNEPVTRAQHLFGLPKLEWLFFDHRGEKLKNRPLEGRTLIAEVRLTDEDDGRYARQRWHAKWDALGDEPPLAFPVQFEIDEHRIEAFLRTKPYGVRAFGIDNQPLDALTNFEVRRFLPLPANLTASHQVLFASNPDKTENLENWMKLRPEIEDELIIERRVNNWWEAVGRYPMRLKPIVHVWKLHGGILELHATAPHGSQWRIIEMNQLEHCHEVSLEAQQIALRHPNRFLKREILVRLECGSYTFEQRFTFLPNPIEWLESELPFGIGWGQL